MAKVEGIRLTENTIREIAENKLIAAQKCSSRKTAEYNHAVYGHDINMLDSSRAWLMGRMKAMSPNADYEQLRINVNKLVLYINPAELEDMVRIVRNEQAQLTA